MASTGGKNVLIIMSDEHARQFAGCYGHPAVRTPNLDSLAERGTLFSSAYTPSPICVPARSSFATGRYVHDLQLWDNDLPYTGDEAASWAERLVARGHRAATIGKLHFAEKTRSQAFPEQILPIYVVPNVAVGYLREHMPVRTDSRHQVERAGQGRSEYVGYDEAVAEAAVDWINAAAAGPAANPWALFVSFVTPHMPLLAPEPYFSMYPPTEVPLPVDWHPDDWPRHPALEANRRLQAMDIGFTEAQVRMAIAAYYGLVSFMDAQVGRVLAALEDAGLADSTMVIYTSDHGETLGAHGLWWKSNMYENAVGIPLIVAGPDVPAGVTCDTPASLIDLFPTVIEGVGAEPDPADSDLPGLSLLEVARSGIRDRVAFSEYHDAYSVSGIFMVRSGPYKYVHYEGFPPQLFDLDDDPEERRDRAEDPAFAHVRARLKAELLELVNPAMVDDLARRSQAARIESRGGLAAVVDLFGSSGHAYTPVPDAFGPQRLR